MLHKQHIVCLLVLAGGAAAQTAFEVASVKPSGMEGGRFTLKGGPGTADPGRIIYTNVPLRIVLLNAYDFRNHQIIGPDWLNTLRFDITATIPEGATKDQFQVMLRNLLISRFRMATHSETRELPIYGLLPAKNGVKIKPAAGDAAEQPEELAIVRPGAGRDGFPEVTLRSPGIVIEMLNGVARVTAKAVPMAKLADFLTGRVGRPVVDRTGLAAIYTFTLYFAPDGAAADGSEPDLFAALQEQLGLRLEAGRGPVEMLIIDRADKVPIEN